MKVPVIRPTDQLRSPREAGQFLGVSRPTIRLWIAEGRLPARPGPNGTLLVRQSDLEGLRAARAASDQPQAA